MIQALERAGFMGHHTMGGYAILRHMRGVTKRITVPMHNRDLRPGTIRSILKQSGLSLDEFLELLSRL